MVQYKLDKKGNLFQGWTFGFSSSKIHSRSLYFKLDVQALFMLIQTHIVRSKQHPCRTWTWVRPTSSNGPDNQLNPHRSCWSHSWQNCQWTTFCPVYSEKNSFFLWPNLIIREGLPRPHWTFSVLRMFFDQRVGVHCPTEATQHQFATSLSIFYAPTTPGFQSPSLIPEVVGETWTMSIFTSQTKILYTLVNHCLAQVPIPYIICLKCMRWSRGLMVLLLEQIAIGHCKHMMWCFLLQNMSRGMV